MPFSDVRNGHRDEFMSISIDDMLTTPPRPLRSYPDISAPTTANPRNPDVNLWHEPPPKRTIALSHRPFCPSTSITPFTLRPSPVVHNGQAEFVLMSTDELLAMPPRPLRPYPFISTPNAVAYPANPNITPWCELPQKRTRSMPRMSRRRHLGDMHFFTRSVSIPTVSIGDLHKGKNTLSLLNDMIAKCRSCSFRSTSITTHPSDCTSEREGGDASVLASGASLSCSSEETLVGSIPPALDYASTITFADTTTEKRECGKAHSAHGTGSRSEGASACHKWIFVRMCGRVHDSLSCCTDLHTRE